MNFKENIAQLHQQLNHPDNLPGIYFRRNHLQYPLVCYINNIIGLYLSSNYDQIPLFIKRAYEHWNQVNPDQPYSDFVIRYLTEMTRFLSSLDWESDQLTLFIPDALMDKG